MQSLSLEENNLSSKIYSFDFQFIQLVFMLSKFVFAITFICETN